MKSKILGLVAVGLLAGPMAAVAAPIAYEVSFSPGGTGSFAYDSSTGVLSGFQWNLGGTIGSIADQSDGTDLFDLLTVSGVGCGVVQAGASICSLGSFNVIGNAPDGATTVSFSSSYSAPNGFGGSTVFPPSMFFSACSNSRYCGNYITNVRASSVAEPGTLALLGLGFAGLGFSRRRKAQ